MGFPVARILPTTVLLVLAGSHWPAHATEPSIDYRLQVRTILSKHCWACHGALKQEAGLRLDASQLIRKGGDDGPVIVAGRPERSVLWQKVTAKLPGRMPPEGKPLSAAELATLKTWITQGANSPKTEQPPDNPLSHWSFTPIRRPDAPDFRDTNSAENTARAAWVRNPIDAFVAARHAAAGIRPRPESDPATLLRRVVIDLTGVPPTRSQLRGFLADTGPGAYERLVEQLLDSPLHGQRWGRHWMDVWRYSDWYGRRGSNEIRYSQRHIWRWRDWIIESINDNKGYDRMLHEMLAADELAPGDDKALRATGFLGRNWYKFDRNTWLFETVERTSQGLLGLAFRCARCHDHKFDPVTQEEYYRFRAFFEPHGFRTEVVAADVKTEIDNRMSTVLSDGLPRVFDEKPDVKTYLFIRGDDRNPDKSKPLSPGVPLSLGGKRFNAQPIPAIELPPVAYIPVLRPAEAARQLKVETDKVVAAEKIVTGLRETITKTTRELKAARTEKRSDDTGSVPFFSDTFDTLDPKHWKVLSGTWTAKNGTLSQPAIGRFRTLLLDKTHPRNFRARMKYRHMKPGSPRSIGFSFDYVGPTESQDVYTAINPRAPIPSVQAFHRTGGKEHYPAAGVRKAPGLKVGRDVVIEVTVVDRRLTIVLDGKTVLEYQLPLERRAGRFALWAHEAHAEFDELEIRALRPTVKRMTQTLARAKTDLPVKRAEATLARANHDSLIARIAAERAKHQPDNDNRSALAMAASRAERHIAVAQAQVKLAAAEAAAKPNQPAIDKARKSVSQATSHRDAADGSYTKFPPAYPTKSTGRRTALARWMTGKNNPRTARVAINQIWLRHTGARFVNTVADFGLRSRPRDFPLLMDWLAAELIESGWDMKHIHRLIVTSATYRMTSSPGPDTDKTWTAQKTSDPDNHLLWRMNSRRMEAEVVRDSLLAISGTLDPAFSGPDIPEAQGQSSPRRSLYFRTTPDNKMLMLELFDLANPNECYDRQQSVVPQQALVLTNSPLALDRSRRLARRLAAEIGVRLGPATDANRDSIAADFVTAAFESVLGRGPRPDEHTACRVFLSRNARLLSDTTTLNTFPASSGTVVAASTDPFSRALENLVHVLVSHNDFVTIR